MSRRYVVDGHNVLHSQAALKDPVQLIDLCASFAAVEGCDVLLVFDGAGDIPDTTIGGLQVIFAGLPSADTVIEREVRAAAGQYSEQLVVTNDNALAAAVAAHIQVPVEAAGFAQALVEKASLPGAGYNSEQHNPSNNSGISTKISPEEQEFLEQLRHRPLG